MPDNIVNTRIKLAIKSSSEWTSSNPTLLNGEVGLDSTNKIIKVGDGSTAWNNVKGWNGMNDAYDTDSTGSAGRYNVTAPGITELYDGLTIRVFLKKAYNSAFNTLNVNGLGEKLIRYRNATAMTSHATTNDIIELTYHTGFGAYNVSYTYCDPVNKANYRGNWAASTVYAVGDSVKYTDSKYYICIKAHTSSTSINTSNFKASTTPYSDLALPGVTNSVTDGWEFVRAYYSDTNYNYFDYNFRPYSGAYPIYRYKLCVLNKDNKLLPLTLTNQENTTNVIKDPLPDAFKPDQVWIYNTTTVTNANSVVPANILGRGFQHTTCTYTFNTTISSYRMIYLKGTYDNTTGLFSLYINPSATNKDSWYVQVPTNSNNITLSSYFTSGYYYICLGGTYSSNNNLQLFASTVMYYFDGTNLVPYAYKTSTITPNLDYLNNNLIGASDNLNSNTYLTAKSFYADTITSYNISNSPLNPTHGGFLLNSYKITNGSPYGSAVGGVQDILQQVITSYGDEYRRIISKTSTDPSSVGSKWFSLMKSFDASNEFLTPTGLWNALRGEPGCTGSVYLYTEEGIDVPEKWYNFLFMPHRYGGDILDNSNYGTIVLFSLIASNDDIIVLRGLNNDIVECRKLISGNKNFTSKDSHVVIDEGKWTRNGNQVTVNVRLHGSADSSTRYYFADLPAPAAPMGLTATSYTTGKPANVGYYYLGIDGQLSNTGTIYKNEAHCLSFSYVASV